MRESNYLFSKQSLLSLGLMFLVGGAAGYFIGSFTVSGAKGSEITIIPNSISEPMVSTDVSLASETSSEFLALNNKEEIVEPQNFAIVYGSINGSKYYNYGCKSGNRIKPENQVFFENEAKALLAGYEPSVNCDF